MDLLRKWPVMTLTVAALWVVTGGLPAAIAAGPANASPGLTNTICPVMEDEPVDPDIFVEHDGQRVYLCCERCLRRFEANPDRYGQDIARVMQVGFAMRSANSSRPCPKHSQLRTKEPSHERLLWTHLLWRR